jgi:polyisoprenyl-teichoic acid--peptidoglycan teichoic acid transferase
MQYASSAVADSQREGGGLYGRPAGSPPVVPPGGKNTKRRKRRDPLWARLMVIFGALLMLTSGVAIFGSKLIFAEATKSVARQNLLGSAGQNRAHVSINGAKNILLVGIDARTGENPNDLVRSDSIMILHIPSGHDRGYLVSIPRDSLVKIPAYNNGKVKYSGGQDKINAAFAFGGQGLTGNEARSHGFELLAKTIQNLTGITFDAGAIVDFQGFQQVVEVLGGVTMYVDEKTTSIHLGTDNKTGKYAEPFHINDDGTVGRAVPGVTPMVYNVGVHDFPAYQALDYVRQRDLLANGDYDYGRQRHQQQFLKAIFKKIFSTGTLSDPTKLGKVLDVVGKAMTVDDGGVPLEDWIFAMKSISPNDLITIKTNDGQLNPSKFNGVDVEIISETSLQLLHSVQSDSVDSFISAHPDWVSQS